ncbi:MAG: sugar phosphate isomerase/epimerase [Deltaproteobacteria bacterium]|nr:sugar phosphate isomerase/epimerase [Deltaproteobacteria bacterium]
MNIGISAYFIKRDNLFSVFKEAIKRGILFFEIPFEIPYLETLDDDFLWEVERLREMGASFSLHGPWIECNLGSLFEEIRIFSRERVLRSIDLARTWKLNPVIIHPAFSFFKEEKMNNKSLVYFFNELERIVIYAKKSKIDLCLENVPFSFSFFHQMESFPQIKEKFFLRVCYDLGHALIAKNRTEKGSIEESIIRDISVFRDEIVHIHFHNNNGNADDHILYSGILDLKRILRELQKIGFNGRIIIESEDVEKFGIDYLISWLKG